MNEATYDYLFTVQTVDAGKRLDVFLAEQLQAQGISRERIKKAVKNGYVQTGTMSAPAGLRPHTELAAPAFAVGTPRVPVDDPAAVFTGIVEHSPKKILRTGECVRLRLEPQAATITPEQGDLRILHQDKTLAVVDKPAGLTVHPAPGRPTGTLAHRLSAHFPELGEQTGLRPGIVHRLDKDTSGLLLVALSEQARLALADRFARHEVYKEYLALVRGVPAKSEEIISAPLGRHPRNKIKMAVIPGGKEAKSLRRTLYADPQGRFSLQAVRIFTGRTHQIRVHCAHIGHPLLGDTLYSRPVAAPAFVDPAPRQMLHAWKLSFEHPFPEAPPTVVPSAPPEVFSDAPPAIAPGEQRPQADMPAAITPSYITAGNTLAFTCPPPEDFSRTIRALGLRTLRMVVTGSPGCGKSTFLAAVRRCDVPVFSADAEVKALYEAGGEAGRFLRGRYGDRFVPHDGAPVDKLALGAAMSESSAFKREIEAMVHPLVHAATEAFFRDCEAQGAPLAVAEIPLFLEAGYTASGTYPLPGTASHSAFVPAEGEETEATLERDRRIAAQTLLEPLRPMLVGIYCPFAVRKERMLQKRGWSEEVIARMESWQWPEEKKATCCDLLVSNTGSEEELEAATRVLLERAAHIRLLRSERLLDILQALYL